MKPVEVITNGNKRAEIYTDENPEDPRSFFDEFGTMICAHRRYSLGDEQIKTSEFESWDEIEDWLIKERNAKVIFSLSLYDHSGLSMHIGRCSGWDTGQVGFIYASEEKCINEFGKDYDIKKIEDILRSEVEVYNMYLSGEVYGYKIFEKKIITEKCPHCGGVVKEYEDEEMIDSCWGYYGFKDIKEEVKSMLHAN